MRRHNLFIHVRRLASPVTAKSFILHVRALVALFTCCVVLAAPATAQQARTVARQSNAAFVGRATDSSINRERNLAVFDEAWRTIAARYYDPNFQGVDWRAMREEFRPLAAAAADEQMLYSVLRRMIANLRDPHTRALPPTEQFNWQDLRALSVGVAAREIRNVGFFVEQVADDSEALRQGARPGDEIISVDGEPVRRRITRLLEGATNPASNFATATANINGQNLTDRAADALVTNAANAEDGERARASGLMFYGARDTFAQIVLRDPQGRTKNLRVRRELRQRGVNFSTRRVVTSNKTIGIVRFDLFKAAVVAQLARALTQELRDTDGLIIDFRRNGGGELEAMVDAASMFLPPDTWLGDFINRDGRTAISARTRAKLLTAVQDLPRYRRPVIILTGAQTASAAEVFAAALRDAGDMRNASDTSRTDGNNTNGAVRSASLVGERSCGCVLGVRRFHALPDGGTLMVSELDYRTARRERLEQRGVAPAILIAPTREDLIRRRDPALERALTSITSSSRPNRLSPL